MNTEEDDICRFCFKLAESQCEPIDDVMKMMLDALLLGMRWNVSKNSIICQECAEITKDSYFFKSTCIYAELCIISFAIDKKETEIEVKNIFGNDKDLETVDQENIIACRLCMEQLERHDCVPLGILLERSTFLEMLEAFMPELDLSIIKNPVVCLPCGEKIENYFKLVHNCLDTETKMNKYWGDTRIASVDQEYVDNLPRNTQICEIKQEPDAFDKKRNEYIEYEITKAEEAVHFKNVVVSKKYKCTMCPHETRHKNLLKTHMLTHRGASKLELYKCAMCNYETRKKGRIKQHILIHEKVEMYKCKMCTYETRYKGYFKKHMTTHNVRIYKCAICNYETRKKAAIKKHMLVHKDPSEVEMYKCTICAFETKYKGCLKTHMQTHMDTSDLQLYKCTICNYKARLKGSIKKHMIIHKDPSEVEIYKCTVCTYGTRHKGLLKRHALRHVVP